MITVPSSTSHTYPHTTTTWMGLWKIYRMMWNRLAKLLTVDSSSSSRSSWVRGGVCRSVDSPRKSLSKQRFVGYLSELPCCAPWLLMLLLLLSGRTCCRGSTHCGSTIEWFVGWLAQGTQGLYVVGTWKLRPDWVKDGELPSLIELNLNLCLALPPSTVSYLFYFYAI